MSEKNVDNMGRRYKYKACYKCELCKKRFSREVAGGDYISDSKAIRIVDSMIMKKMGMPYNQDLLLGIPMYVNHDCDAIGKAIEWGTRGIGKFVGMEKETDYDS